MAEESEVLRCQCDSPGSSQPRTVLQALKQSSLRSEDIHKTTAVAAIVIGTGLGGVLLGVRHDDIGAHRLHVVGCKFAWYPVIVEPFSTELHALEVPVEHLDFISAEIGGKEKVVALGLDPLKYSELGALFPFIPLLVSVRHAVRPNGSSPRHPLS